jgi:hypothetical protein
MVKDGTMNTENKQTTHKEEELKEQLFFTETDKNCEDCEKEKEVEVSFGFTTKSEWENIMKLIKKYNITRQEQEYIYNFYNREFKENKRIGCGKCFVNVCKSLEKRWVKYNS